MAITLRQRMNGAAPASPVLGGYIPQPHLITVKCFVVTVLKIGMGGDKLLFAAELLEIISIISICCSFDDGVSFGLGLLPSPYRQDSVLVTGTHKSTGFMFWGIIS